MSSSEITVILRDADDSKHSFKFLIDFKKLHFLTHDLAKLPPYNMPLIVLNFYNPALGSGVPGADLHIFTCMTTLELWGAILLHDSNDNEKQRDALQKAKNTKMRYFRYYQQAA